MFVVVFLDVEISAGRRVLCLQTPLQACYCGLAFACSAAIVHMLMYVLIPSTCVP